MTDPTAPERRSSSTELHALGLRCRLEPSGNLAILIPAAGERGLEDVSVRRRVVAALRAQGFSHVAVEPGDEDESERMSVAPPA